jgi:site-specific DNA-methyltransferase (adenine-specific)
LKKYKTSKDAIFDLRLGDSTKSFKRITEKYNMVFADPPYFLSRGGQTIQSGKIVSVNKGEWDKTDSPEFIHDFNFKWLTNIRSVMEDNGTIWISGTLHNIFNIAKLLDELNFKVLNVITWQKTNPPPNFACRAFTHSTEVIIWARKEMKVAHFYNYALMKKLNGNKQMKDVWTMPAIARWEKSNGKHPTQKPLSVLTRIILASTKPGDKILDPFTGSSTSGIAANLLGRKFTGIDFNIEFLKLSKMRAREIKKPGIKEKFLSKIKGFAHKNQLTNYLNIESQLEFNNIGKLIGGTEILSKI